MKNMLPDLRPHYGQLLEVLEPEGKPRAKVAFFLGCVADSLYPETNLNTARVLQANGCEVWIPRSQGCCGALHYHAAEEPAARQFAAANCDAFLDRVLKRIRLFADFTPIIRLIAMASHLSLFLVAGIMMIHGNMEAGSFMILGQAMGAILGQWG